MVDFREIIDNLVDMGFYNVVLPFFLVYVIVFAILEKSNIFSGGNAGDKQVRNVNAVIAFVFALFVVASIQTVLVIESLILNIVLILVFILVLLLVLGFLFGDEYKNLFKGADGKMNAALPWTIGIIVLLITLSIFFSILGFWSWLVDWWDSLDFEGGTVSTIIVLLLIGLVLYWITKSDAPKGESK